MVITKTNRIISFILVICMIFSMLPVNVFATETGNNVEVVTPGDNEAYFTINYYKDRISDDNLIGTKKNVGEIDSTIDYSKVDVNAYLPGGYFNGIVQTDVSDTTIKADGSSVVHVLYERDPSMETTYTVKYYKDEIKVNDNLLGQYQVTAYAGEELDFDVINLNVYLPDDYDGGIVVKADSDNVVKADGSSVVYVLYTPATPEGQELLNKVKAENEAVEDITEHLVYIEDYGYDKFNLSFNTNVSTIKSDVIPTDTILIVDASTTMLSQTINVSNTYSENTTISGREALEGMIQAFTEYYFETQPENSKLGIVYYGHNYMRPYDNAIFVELGKSSVEDFMNQVEFNNPIEDWNNGAFAFKQAKDMLLASESLYLGQDGNYYERARHVIFITSNNFYGYVSGYEGGIYHPGYTPNIESLNQAAIMKGKLGDTVLANYMTAVLSTGVNGTLLANYQYGFGHMSASDKNDAWLNMQFHDHDTWSHTAGNFDRYQTGGNATFHTVGMLTSKLTETRKEETEKWLKEMASKGEYYSGDNTADLYDAVEDIITDMYVANDIYIDCIIDENFKVIEAPDASKVLKNSDGTTTVMYGPMDCNGIFHVAKELVVAAKAKDYKEAPNYRIVTYTYVNGQKVLLKQYDLVTDKEATEWEESGYTPITSFEYELVGTTVTLKKHIGSETVIKIAPTYNINGNAYKTTKIGNNCFEGKNITSIEIADNITKIGMEAFKDCTSLTSVKLPSNLDAIYNGTFKNCTNLKSIELPDKMTYLGSYAFYNSGLTHINVVDNIHYVGLYCFAECKDLRTIQLSRSLDRVQNGTFMNCVSLKEIDLPDNVYGINNDAFNGCVSLTELNINPNCYFIGDKALANCSELTTLTIAESTIYSDTTFADCNKLETIIVTKGEYSYSVVANYENGNHINSVWQQHKDTVKTVIFEDGIKKLGTYLCYQMPELETVEFGGTIEAVRSYTCFECPKLVNVTMHEGIGGIGDSAFQNCDALTEVTIPNTVTWMFNRYGEGGSFSGCDNLTKLTAPIDLDIYGSFGGTPIKTLIYTAGLTGRGLDSDRTSDTGWTDFNWFYGMGTSKIETVVFSEGITYIGANLLTIYISNNEPIIRSITLPSTLEEIGVAALNNGWSKALATTGSDKYGEGYLYLPNVTKIGDSGMRSVTGTEPYGEYILVFGKNVHLGPYALYGTKFKDIIFEQGVSYIGAYALSGSDFASTKEYINLTGITEIADYGLAGLPAMEEVTIGDDLVSIGTHAFDGSGIKELVLGPNVKTIKPDAFVGADKLMHIFVDKNNPYFETNEEGTILWNENKTEILWISALYAGELFIPKATTLTSNLVQGKQYITKIIIEQGNVSEIPARAFAGCTALEDIVIPNGVTAIRNSAFRDCVSLKNVSLPEGLTHIDGIVFFNCTSLVTLELPSTLKTIATENSTSGATFGGCVNLVHIEFPEGLEAIGGNWGNNVNGLFSGCSRLETVTLPSTLKSGVDNRLFTNCHSLANVYLGEGSTTLSVNEDNTALMNFDGTTTYWSCNHVYEEETELITEIPDNAYKGNTDLRRYDIANTIVRIGVSAFQNSGLAGVIEIPESVTEIGANAFNNTRIKKIILDANITTIPDSCFSNNGTYLKEFVWNTNTVTTIGNYAFTNMSQLKEFHIPEGVTTMGASIFDGCTGAEVITLPSTLTGTLGQYAFRNCDSLKELIIPEGVTGIDGECFYSCDNLEYIYIPSTLTSINTGWREGAFAQSPNLRLEVSADNPNYSTNADGTVLYNKNKTAIVWYNRYIDTVDLSDSNITSLSGTFNGHTVIKNVILPETLKTLGGNTFKGCTNMKELTLPSTMTTVNYSDFQNSGLEHIYVADGNTALTTNEDNTALYNADGTYCYWALEFFRVNDVSYSDLQAAINAASNGDTIYVVNSYLLVSAITIPENKELTIMPLERNVTITQGAYGHSITHRSKLTLSGNGEYTLTIKRTYAILDQIQSYADLVLENGVRIYGTSKDYSNLICGYNSMTLTVKSDVIVGTSTNFFYNSNATYIIEPGVTFQNLKTIVTNHNGVYENFSCTFTNCNDTLNKFFEYNGVLYKTLNDVVNAASNGDIIYVVEDTTIAGATLPADKEVTLKPKDKNVVLYTSASITNNSKLTIEGNGEYTLTVKANKTGVNTFNAYADIVVGNGGIISAYQKGNSYVVNMKAEDAVVTVKEGGKVSYANYGIYNSVGSYVFEKGSMFSELTNIVYQENGTYKNLDADVTNCNNTLDKPFIVNDIAYKTFEEAIEAANDGDTIYIGTSLYLTGAVTFPADKELTLSALDRNVTIYQSNNYKFTNNSKLIIKGKDGYTLTIKATVKMEQFHAYADLIFDEGAVIYGQAMNNGNMVVAKAACTVTVKSGAEVGYAERFLHNNNASYLYNFEDGAKFTNLKYMIYNVYACNIGKDVIYDNVTNPVYSYYLVGGNGYNTLAHAVTAAINGDIIYVVRDRTDSAVTIPTDKELTLSAYDKDVVLSMSGTITNNNKLTITGKDGYTLTVKTTKTGVNTFTANADLVFDDGSIVYSYQKGNSSVVNTSAAITVYVKTGAIIGYASRFLSNGGSATYNVKPGVTFTNLTSIVSNKNGTYKNFTATYIDCDGTLETPFMIGEDGYGSLQAAIDAASNGDIIYVLDNYTLSSAVTIPTDKELTFSAYNKDVVITQNATITNNSKLTITGKDGYTLTFRAGKTNVDQFLAYADITICDGAIVKGYQMGNYSLVIPKANMTLTIKEGATVGLTNYVFYNKDVSTATYVFEKGVTFEDATYIVYTHNGFASGKIICNNVTNSVTITGDLVVVNGESYDTLQEAVDAASDGDIVYVLGNININSDTNIPENKQITIMPFNKDVVITQSANITHYGNLTLSGNEGYKLTIIQTNGASFLNEDPVVLDRVEVCVNYAYSIIAGETNVINGNIGTDGAVDLGYDLNFDVTVPADGTYYFYADASYATRGFNLYVDGVQVFSGTDCTVKRAMSLTAGTHTIRITQRSGYTPIWKVFHVDGEAKIIDTVPRTFKVNDLGYDTLQEAIDAANSGDTIYVQNNHTMSGKVTIPADKEITLMASGGNWTISDTSTNDPWITVNGILHVCAEENASLTLWKNNNSSNLVNVNGTLTTEGNVTFKRYSTAGYSLICTTSVKAVVILNEGTILTNSKWGIYNNVGGSITINDGVVFDTIANAFYRISTCTVGENVTYINVTTISPN